ncbi:MAG: LamG domain-containing protein, partial [Patescibacteria group bacterium]|nr:LamG domain-containing protein [Patescibacteria group bacterium]
HKGFLPGVLELGTHIGLTPQTRDLGLVGYWSFDEGSGTTAYDYSGNGNDATIHGASWTTPASCSVDECLSFDGVDDWAEIFSDPSLNLTHEGTISFWYKTDAWQSIHAMIIEKGPGGGWCSNIYNPFTLFNHYTANYVSLSICSSSGVNNVNISPRPSTGIWHHYLYTFDGSKLYAYLDGVLKATVNQTVDVRVQNNSIYIGNNSASGYTTGWLDDLRIYNRGLTAKEVETIYRKAN